MSYTVAAESFDSLTAIYRDSGLPLKWDPLFVTPAWMKTWWEVFQSGEDLLLFSVKQDGDIIGIAPLKRSGTTASFVGGADVCDYFDFVVTPGSETGFYATVFDHLSDHGIDTLFLQSLRPDSNVLNHLTEMALSRGFEVTNTPNDVSSEMPLPPTWDEYLQFLNKKQRHEVKRKLRRLEEAGSVVYHSIREPEEVAGAFDTFLKLFTESRDDKSDFLNGQRETFFRKMSETMSGEGIFRIGILELDSVPVAMIMFFDYNNRIYLYNSGFETEYTGLSVGLLSKVLCIRESVESGKDVFDFLKGDEIYKSRLGGTEIPLTDCRIIMK